MLEHFKIDGPTVLSFSGGRTSGFMLDAAIRANGGMPDCAKVIFCNTGKEREETLEFVEECSQRWQVKITWLEYRRTRGPKPGHSFAEVDFATASRKGEPFEAIIEARSFLPNQAMRFCTGELKIKTTSRYMRSLGWNSYKNMIGIRADEPRRYAKLTGCGQKEQREQTLFGPEKQKRRENIPGETAACPLYQANVKLEDVMAFWKAQPFDLKLKQDEGNCDLCFLKGEKKLQDLIARRPESADWWIEQEKKLLGRHQIFGKFSKRHTYEQLHESATGKVSLPLFPFDFPDCHCTD
jgi:3'-phosphoadenosine 5'-phosphosulfate sulfotransferase (PAPS reductase)/FAD synthetase